MTPLVSIAIPVRNGVDTVARAIRAALAQDHEAIEVIVADNASTDGTSDMVTDLARHDPRVVHHRSPESLSLRENWIRSVHLARGEHVKWTGHDDWFAEDFVSRCVAALAQSPAAVSAYSRAIFLTDQGVMFGATDDSPPGVVGSSRITRLHGALWRVRSYQVATAGLIRRDALLETAMVVNIEPADKLLVAELSLLGELAVVPEPLLFFTKSPAHLSKNEWLYNDPANAGRRRKRSRRTHGAFREAFARHGLSRREWVAAEADLALRFALRQAVHAKAYATSRLSPPTAEEALRAFVNAVPVSTIDIPDRVMALLAHDGTTLYQGSRSA